MPHGDVSPVSTVDLDGSDHLSSAFLLGIPKNFLIVTLELGQTPQLWLKTLELGDTNYGIKHLNLDRHPSYGRKVYPRKADKAIDFPFRLHIYLSKAWLTTHVKHE